MPVFEGSRYENALQLRVRDAAGVIAPALYLTIGSVTSNAMFRTYVLIEGERYDQLAHRLYGDPQLWWVLANLNPEYLYPDELPGGTTIRIPA